MCLVTGELMLCRTQYKKPSSWNALSDEINSQSINFHLKKVLILDIQGLTLKWYGIWPVTPNF